MITTVQGQAIIERNAAGVCLLAHLLGTERTLEELAGALRRGLPAWGLAG